MLVALLHILGGMEPNTGPPVTPVTGTVRLRVFNVLSATLVHDIFASHNIDLLVLTET